MISLEYEGLEYHCSHCNRLSHLARNCPELPQRTSLASRASNVAPDPRRDQPLHITSGSYNAQKQQKSAHSPRQDSAFQHRVDRHGRPFGNRIPLPPARGQPLNNKIVPQAETVKHRGSSHPRDRPHPHHQSSSAASDIRRVDSSPRGTSPQRVWREKQRPSSTNQMDLQIEEAPLALISPVQERTPLPLERNLALCDFPQPPSGIPTMEEVMNDLREVTYQYTSCADPTESAARRQRVMNPQDTDLMADTAAGIIAASYQNLGREQNPSPLVAVEINTPPTETHRTTSRLSVRRSIGKQTRSRRIPPSPHYGGSSFKRRILSQAHASSSRREASARHGFPHASPVQPLPPRSRNHQDTPPTTVQVQDSSPPREPARSDQAARRSQSDFHTHHPPLP